MSAFLRAWFCRFYVRQQRSKGGFVEADSATPRRHAGASKKTKSDVKHAVQSHKSKLELYSDLLGTHGWLRCSGQRWFRNLEQVNSRSVVLLIIPCFPSVLSLMYDYDNMMVWFTRYVDSNLGRMPKVGGNLGRQFNQFTTFNCTRQSETATVTCRSGVTWLPEKESHGPGALPLAYLSSDTCIKRDKKW